MVGASRGDGSEVSTKTSQSTPKIASTTFSESSSLQITAHKINGKNIL